jgi:hypothetical protein
MREQEMRMRVFRFLKTRMRNMIMPATMGIGLAVGGCAKEEAIPVYSAPLQDSGMPAQTDVLLASDAPPASSDSAAATPDSAPSGPDSKVPGKEVAPETSEVSVVADASPDGLGPDAPTYGSDGRPPRDLPPAEASTEDAYAKPDQAVAIDGAGIDTGADLGGTVVKYSASVPDAAAEKPTIVPLYTALMPDAGAAADSMVVRYMAVMPDTAPDLGLAVPDYMAQSPS